MTGGSERPPRSAGLPAGFDEADPYADVDLADLPAWWREHVETFRSHGMRPYRPPRFADGTISPPVVAALEDELGVAVQVRARNPNEGDDWAVEVDGEPVGTVGRRRTSEGYTEYELSADAFEALVRDAVGERYR